MIGCSRRKSPPPTCPGRSPGTLTPCVWLPENLAIFTEFHDYGIFGAPVNGLYLTPVSGSLNKLSEILTGEYKEWAAVILRSIDTQKFPLPWATLLGLENECVFFADHDRERPETR